MGCNAVRRKQEKPTNCGTKAADVFLAGKLKCKSTEYFGAVSTTTTSQRLSIQSKESLHLLPFGRNVQESFQIPDFGGYVSVSGLGFAPIESPPKTTQYLSIQSFALSATTWLKF